jgi:hypothetical protein
VILANYAVANVVGFGECYDGAVNIIDNITKYEPGFVKTLEHFGDVLLDINVEIRSSITPKKLDVGAEVRFDGTMIQLESDFELDELIPKKLDGDSPAVITLLSDDGTLWNQHQQELVPYVRNRRALIAVTVSQMAKNKFPISRRTEANRLVVRRFVHDALKQHGMRPSHIRKTIDMAVSLAFTPDESDLEVIAYESSIAYRKRVAFYETPYSTGWFSSWLSWMPRDITPRGYASC